MVADLEEKIYIKVYIYGVYGLKKSVSNGKQKLVTYAWSVSPNISISEIWLSEIRRFCDRLKTHVVTKIEIYKI